MNEVKTMAIYKTMYKVLRNSVLGLQVWDCDKDEDWNSFVFQFLRRETRKYTKPICIERSINIQEIYIKVSEKLK